MGFTPFLTTRAEFDTPYLPLWLLTKQQKEWVNNWRVLKSPFFLPIITPLFKNDIHNSIRIDLFIIHNNKLGLESSVDNITCGLCGYKIIETMLNKETKELTLDGFLGKDRLIENLEYSYDEVLARLDYVRNWDKKDMLVWEDDKAEYYFKPMDDGFMLLVNCYLKL